MIQKHWQNLRSQPWPFPGTGNIRRFGQSDDPEIIFDSNNLSILFELFVRQSGQAFDLVVTVAPKQSGPVEELELAIVNKPVKNRQSAAMNPMYAV